MISGRRSPGRNRLMKEHGIPDLDQESPDIALTPCFHYPSVLAQSILLALDRDLGLDEFKSKAYNASASSSYLLKSRPKTTKSSSKDITPRRSVLRGGSVKILKTVRPPATPHMST